MFPLHVYSTIIVLHLYSIVRYILCELIFQEEQRKRAAIIRAQGDSKAADLLATAFGQAGDGLVELRKLEAAEDIAHFVSQNPNVVYLPQGQNTLLSLPQ